MREHQKNRVKPISRCHVGGKLINTNKMKRVLFLGIFVGCLFSVAQTYAQCENAVKGKFVPLVVHENVSGEKLGQLGIAGFQATEGTVFPYYYEWRKEDASGAIIKAGKLQSAMNNSEKDLMSAMLSGVLPGKYVLVVYDNSTPCRKVTRKLEIKNIDE